MIDFIEAGKCYKSHGIKGILDVEMNPIFKKHILSEKVVFFKINGCHVPFFIESCKTDGSTLLKLEGVDNPEQARVLSHQSFYIDENKLSKATKRSAKIQGKSQGLDGYSIHDRTSNYNVAITSIEEYPSQLLARVMHDGKSLLIPLHEDFVEEIDEVAKIVFMILPEGIFEF
ncbi:MAG TPA: hypothetical protein PLD02_02345 [Saprospiraceae bacterium]|nr:hypothetical protein [Saprospiraceae bacterium]